MEDVVFLSDRAPQVGDGRECRAGGCRIIALVDAQVRLQMLVEFRSQLADQSFGSDDFVFAERIEKSHEFLRLKNLPFRTPEECGYFLYCVGCGPFSSISRSQMAPSRV